MDKDATFSNKLQALTALLIKTPKTKTASIEKWVASLSDSEKAQVAKKLSVSRPGAILIQNLVKKKVIPTSSIDYNSAIIMQKQIGKRNKPLPIYLAAQKEEKQRKTDLKKKTDSYIKKVAKLKGNPDMGQAVFGSCMACHSVGGQGQDIAPPLDGGKDRDVAHLITAIMNPDEAVEAVYGLHYAVRKDGKYIEGYLKKSDDAGITIAVMGGGSHFIPRHLLLHEGGIDGRSFMPASYGSFSEQTIADLATYIKTIK